MHRIVFGCLLFAAVVGFVPAVAAKEVVEFTDGRYLEIRSYTVRGDTIRLDVDRGSFLVIPLDSVDEIRRDWNLVFSREQALRQSAPVARPLGETDDPLGKRLDPSSERSTRVAIGS
jgi:hypothetical protein